VFDISDAVRVVGLLRKLWPEPDTVNGPKITTATQRSSKQFDDLPNDAGDHDDEQEQQEHTGDDEAAVLRMHESEVTPGREFPVCRAASRR
jgi:hypothetical protein